MQIGKTIFLGSTPVVVVSVDAQGNKQMGRLFTQADNDPGTENKKLLP